LLKAIIFRKKILKVFENFLKGFQLPASARPPNYEIFSWEKGVHITQVSKIKQVCQGRGSDHP